MTEQSKSATAGYSDPVQTSGQSPFSENPYFDHVERAPYELGYLLKQLPAGFSGYSKAEPEAILIAKAATQHASNANETLLYGLQALGKIVFVAAGNNQNDIDRNDLSDLGCLIQHIATEMQFLREIEDHFGHAVRVHTAPSAKEGK